MDKLPFLLTLIGCAVNGGALLWLKVQSRGDRLARQLGPQAPSGRYADPVVPGAEAAQFWAALLDGEARPAGEGVAAGAETAAIPALGGGAARSCSEERERLLLTAGAGGRGGSGDATASKVGEDLGVRRLNPRSVKGSRYPARPAAEAGGG